MTLHDTLPVHPRLRHPLTGEPLVAVGFSRRGPIWPIIGASDDGGDGGDGGDDGDKGGDGGGDDKPPGSKSDDPKLKAARDEAAANRVKAREASDRADDLQRQLDELRKGQSGGGNGGGSGKGDDGKTAAELETARQEAAAAKAEAEEARAKVAAVELRDTIRTAAAKRDVKGDADALLDSNTFMSTVSKLDPTEDNHADKVAEAIKTAVKSNPRLGQAPGRGGSHFAGGSGESGKRPGIHGAVSGHYGS